MGITEIGSLDLDTVHVGIGGVIVDSTTLAKGNKFVVVEHFIDRDGKPVEEKFFDPTRMQYSFFVSPEENTERGRHKWVMNHHNNFVGKIGRTVGGGLLQVRTNNTVDLSLASGDYDAEPQKVRDEVFELLLPILQEKLKKPELVKGYVNTVQLLVNVYWYRFRQVLEEIITARGKEKMDTSFSIYESREKRHLEQLEEK
jgi:hypothetical protein